MNVVVNPKDHVTFSTNDSMQRGFVIVEVESGFHYISNDKVYFIPRSQAEDIVKRERVRNIFGTEE